MRHVYSKKGVKVTCENDQYDLMIGSGYTAEAPKAEAPKVEAPKVEAPKATAKK